MDVRDPQMGAWFEGVVARISRHLTPTERGSRTDDTLNGSDSPGADKENQKFDLNQNDKKSEEEKKAAVTSPMGTTNDPYYYHVKLEG